MSEDAAAPAPLHAACVPVLRRYLGCLQRLLGAAQALPPAQAAALMQARLAPDMLPFARQVETAAHFACRTAWPLAGRAVPAFEPSAPEPAALQARVAQVRAALDTLPPADFADAATRLVHEQAGDAPVVLPGDRFLAEYALPNFLFHVCMAYAIARAQGLPVGKADYDGFHAYPRGPGHPPI